LAGTWSKKHSDEAKKAVSKANKRRFVGEKNYFYGKFYTAKNNPMFGKHHTKESRKKMSEAKKGKKHKPKLV
jgi:hypothetical protein